MSETKLPVWDLSAYYSDISDPKIDADIADAQKDAEEFERKYRGKFTPETSPEFVLGALKEYESISLKYSWPIVFAESLSATDSTKPENGALLQKTYKAATDIGSILTFFSVQLSEMPGEALERLANDPALANYKHFFQRIIEYKPHRLSEKEEVILGQKALTGRAAFIRLYDEHFASKKFQILLDGKEQEMTETQVLDLMRSPVRETRKAAAESLTKGLQKELKLYSFITNTLGEDKAVNDKLAKFEFPAQSRHMDNEVSPEIVDLMTQVITSNYDIVEDYYLAKKEWMGLSELFEYDRYAPITESSTQYSYDQAKEIVLNAFNRFSSEFGSAAKLFFDNSWIHAPVADGKRGGAYCSGGTPDKHPLVLVNYQGKMDDVSTLAHELGHGVNDYLMRVQTPINYDTTLVLAETASVFAEMLVFDDLKERITDPKEKFALYAGKIEGIFATVFRQISMYQFEKAFHEARRQKGEQSPEAINEMWLTTQVKMFGKSITFNPGYEVWWSYIPHFIHTPFYVYAYAFGELLVLSLYAQYKKEGESFVPKYLALMRAGTSAYPHELLKPLGIDLHSKEFWQGGIQIIRDMVSETKALKA